MILTGPYCYHKVNKDIANSPDRLPGGTVPVTQVRVNKSNITPQPCNIMTYYFLKYYYCLVYEAAVVAASAIFCM